MANTPNDSGSKPIPPDRSGKKDQQLSDEERDFVELSDTVPLPDQLPTASGFPELESTSDEDATAQPPDLEPFSSDDSFDLPAVQSQELEPISSDNFGLPPQFEPISADDTFGPRPSAKPELEPISTDDTFGLSAIPPLDSDSSDDGLGLSSVGTFIADGSNDDLTGLPTVDTGLSGEFPVAEASSGHHAAGDSDARIGNLEPVAPVAPVSGWLDSKDDLIATPAPRMVDPVADAEPSAEAVESSDIFSDGPVLPADPVESSDVLVGTASPPPTAGSPDRPSNAGPGFGRPESVTGIDDDLPSSELPVADELGGDDNLFDMPVPAALPFDSARLGDAPGSSDDSSDFGSNPNFTPDASSILSELSDPGEITIADSSDVRLESPGVGRTLSSDRGGTEFDLTIEDGPLPAELEAADAESRDRATPVEWQGSGSDVFGDARNAPEPGDSSMQSYNTRLSPDDPSSIFDIDPPVDSTAASELSEEEAAVEFSDHPDAEVEAAAAELLSGPAPSPAPPIRRPTPRPSSEADFELPAKPPSAADSGNVDWASAPEVASGDSPPAGVFKRGVKGDADAKGKPSQAKSAEAGSDRVAADPSIEIDWMAGSSTDSPPLPAKAIRPSAEPSHSAKSRDADRPAREPLAAREKKGGGGWVGGTLLGMVVATAACAAVYLSWAVPNAEKTAAVQPPRQNPDTANPDGKAPAGVEPVANVPGQGRLYAKIQELGKSKAAAAAADDAELKQAREELQAAADDTAKGDRAAVEATIYLGVSHELAGDLAAARKVYESGINKFPKYRATFQAALDRLTATAPIPDGVSRRLTPAEFEQLLVAVVLLAADDPPAKDDEPEAGAYFWKAVNAAAAGKYTDAVADIAKAKAAHARQAKAAPGRGVNPLSDPLEQIFPRCCDDLQAYWELRAAVYSNKTVAELVKKDGAVKAIAELQRRADGAVKLMTDLNEATDKLTKVQGDLKTANDKVAKAETGVKDATDKVSVSEKLLKDLKMESSKKEQQYALAEAAAKKEIKSIEDKALKSESDRKKSDDLVAALAKELQTMKLLPETYDAAALLAAQKAAAARATGPTLTALVPAGMMAVGGGGLTAGQLVDLSERLVKAETAAKLAVDKLATETKKLTDSHAGELKTLKDGYAEGMKKLMDAYATDAAKLKAEQAAELKKTADRFAADMKKMTDDNVATVKKLTDDYDAKVKSAEAAAAQEKQRADALVAKFKVDLGNAMSPSQALDVWLPLLTDLRRPTDAVPAIATAEKVLATAPAESEDAAKAKTVAGLAHFLKGNLAKARELFADARSGPAYRAAAGKPWAVAADTGLQSVDDPLAPYRQPIANPKRDAKAAARALDTGVKAYKAGRFPAAVAALTDSTKADPTDPVAWYFLGAAKWAAGAADRAKDDFRQGAEREKASTLPTRVISDTLSPIQGAARDALTDVRP